MSFRRPIVMIMMLIGSILLLSYTVSPIVISWVSSNILVSTFLGQTITFILPILGLYYLTSTDQETLFDLSKDFKPLEQKDKVHFILLGVSIFGVVYTFKILVELIRAKNGIIAVTDTIDFHLLSFLGMVVIFALVPAFLEEIFYKGIVSKIALNKFELYFIVVLFFTLSHKGFIQGFVAFLFSNLLYLLFLRTKNLSVMILIHFVYNTLVIIFSNYVRLPFELSYIRLNDRLILQIDGFIYVVVGILILLVLVMTLLLTKVKNNNANLDNHLERKDWIHRIVFGVISLFYIINFFIINGM